MPLRTTFRGNGCPQDVSSSPSCQSRRWQSLELSSNIFSIVLGSLNGQIEPAIKKLSTLHSKNDFALALLTGDVFASDASDDTLAALLDGSLAFPLPTYFTIGTKALPSKIAAKLESSEDICENLHYLGKRSTTKTSAGVRIVCLGGAPDTDTSKGLSIDDQSPQHTAADAKSLRGASHADILLTAAWPLGVWKNSKVALEPQQIGDTPSSLDIAELCAALKPRYHLSASPTPFLYEREAFLHPREQDSELVPYTRFISMAPFGNEAKAKSIYAFTLNKADTSPPAGATYSPFQRGDKRAKDAASYSHFDNYGRDQHNYRSKKRKQDPPPGPNECYFCISNSKSTHLCCSIGDDAYVTVAKGPLSTGDTFAGAGLKLPAHLIVIPLSHSPTISHLGSPSDASSDAYKTIKEMERFRESIQAAISAKSSRKLGLVTWEISRNRNIHLNWQMIPLPSEMIYSGIAETAFRVEAENQKAPTFSTKELTLEKQAAYGDFFRVWLWADNGEDKIKSTTLVMPLPEDMRFDLQFGRRVVAKLLGLESRIIWQDCAQTKEAEEQDVEAFREAYKEWDFTLE